jgi:hypothetical protein
MGHEGVNHENVLRAIEGSHSRADKISCGIPALPIHRGWPYELGDRGREKMGTGLTVSRGVGVIVVAKTVYDERAEGEYCARAAVRPGSKEWREPHPHLRQAVKL